MAKKSSKKYSAPTALESLKALRTGTLPMPPSEKRNPVIRELIRQLPTTRVRIQDIRFLDSKRRSLGHTAAVKRMTEEYLTIAELAARLKLEPKTVKNKMAAGFCLTLKSIGYILDIKINDGNRTPRNTVETRADTKAARRHGRNSRKQSCQTGTRRAGNFRASGAAYTLDCCGCRC
jgi:hypothetical protein